MPATEAKNLLKLALDSLERVFSLKGWRRTAQGNALGLISNDLEMNRVGQLTSSWMTLAFSTPVSFWSSP
jgi:hypothetical protein